MSNYWKKPGQHNIDYIDKICVLKSNYDVDIKIEMHIYECHITPTRIVKNKTAYEILQAHPTWIIHGFTVTTENNKVKRVSLVGNHPNQNWENGIYCVPDQKLNLTFDDSYYHNLITNIKTYYLDDCYVVPQDKDFKYRKMNSMFMKLNRGDTL